MRDRVRPGKTRYLEAGRGLKRGKAFRNGVLEVFRSENPYFLKIVRRVRPDVVLADRTRGRGSRGSA
jgi:hypothetical protein